MADRTLAFAGVATYGFILLVNYGMNYLDNYPEKKLEHGIYLDFKLLLLRKINTIDYTEYQKIGTGKLVQRIENGSAAGRNVLFNFWLCLIRDLLPTIGFSIYFIWEIDEKVTYVLFVGYTVIFIITNILLKFLYKIKGNYSEPHAQNRIFDAFLDIKFTCYLLIVVTSPYKLCQICL